MKHTILPLIILSLILLSCKKETAEFTVSGTVFDDSFQNKLTNTTVNIYKVDAATGEEDLAAATKTDASGNYSFTLKRDQFSSIVVKIFKPNYFEASESMLFSDITTTQDNIININTTAKSWAKIHIVNNSPSSVIDQIELIKQEGKTNCEECCSNDPVVFYGIIDTTFYCINDANTTYSLYYNVIDSPNVGIREVTTVAFDTTLLEISY